MQLEPERYGPSILGSSLPDHSHRNPGALSPRRRYARTSDAPPAQRRGGGGPARRTAVHIGTRGGRTRPTVQRKTAGRDGLQRAVMVEAVAAGSSAVSLAYSRRARAEPEVSKALYSIPS